MCTVGFDRAPDRDPEEGEPDSDLSAPLGRTSGLLTLRNQLDNGGL
jgi:hypothetical protein